MNEAARFIPRSSLPGLAARSLAALVITLGPAVGSSADAPEVPPRVAGLVQVIVTFQTYNPRLPWQRSAPGTRMGYALACGEGRFITTEGLVRNHTLVEVRHARSGEKITVAVRISDYQANLALLESNGPDEGTPPEPIPIADRVPRNAEVKIAQLDETQEVQLSDARVLQISMATLPSSPYSGLTFTLLTDVNVNGQGAPVLYQDELAGLVMSYDRTARVGKMVPYPAIRRFIEAASKPRYDGFASAGFVWKPLVDPAKRAFLSVTNENRGVLVVSCLPGSGAADALESNDVILRWDGHAIDNLGFYEDADFGRLLFPYLINGRRSPGQVAESRICRDRQVMDIRVDLTRRLDRHALIPQNVSGRQTEYLVTGGFVIQELAADYLRARGPNWMKSVDPILTHLYLTRRLAPTFPGERVVLLARVLPDPINIGYQHFNSQVIKQINGKKVSNMSDVFRIVDEDGLLRLISLRSMGIDIAIDETALPEANARLAKAYRIPKLRHQRSADVPPAEPAHREPE